MDADRHADSKAGNIQIVATLSVFTSLPRMEKASGFGIASHISSLKRLGPGARHEFAGNIVFWVHARQPKTAPTWKVRFPLNLGNRNFSVDVPGPIFETAEKLKTDTHHRPRKMNQKLAVSIMKIEIWK